MTVLTDYFWPGVAIALALGAIANTIVFRKPGAATRRWRWLGGCYLFALAAMAIWSGPLGAADRLAKSIETTARTTMDDFEMTQVSATLQRAPLTRRLVLTGPVDDFQARELVRVISAVPGAHDATWIKGRYLPLLAEAALLQLVGFLLGMLLAYLVEAHRRYNAQWNW